MTNDGEREPRWQDFAPCAHLTELFFSDKQPDIDEAKKICKVCPVKEPCDAESIILETSANNVFGVRAGMSASQRRHRQKQPRRGGRSA